jgi:hypothetical protein
MSSQSETNNKPKKRAPVLRGHEEATKLRRLAVVMGTVKQPVAMAVQKLATTTQKKAAETLERPTEYHADSTVATNDNTTHVDESTRVARAAAVFSSPSVAKSPAPSSAKTVLASAAKPIDGKAHDVLNAEKGREPLDDEEKEEDTDDDTSFAQEDESFLKSYTAKLQPVIDFSLCQCPKSVRSLFRDHS